MRDCRCMKYGLLIDTILEIRERQHYDGIGEQGKRKDAWGVWEVDERE